MSLNSPKVTVLTSVYNGEAYLKEAVESILNQTFRDFEFIIINDGSTDGTAAILTPYENMDGRIRVYYQENKGITVSRNRGCQLAKGEYIAVMDADDVSLPERLAKQVQYLETHPGVGVLGTWVDFIDAKCQIVGNWHMPTAPGVIGWSLLFGNSLAHSSVMIRRNIIERLDLYRPDALLAEDYDLWARASFATQIANIPEILVRYRVWQGSASSSLSQTLEQYALRVMHSIITRLLDRDVPLEAVASLRRAVHGFPSLSLEQIETSASLIGQLYKAYLGRYSLNRAEHREVTHDASIKLWKLAVLAKQLSILKGFAILIEALKIYPQLLLSRPIITELYSYLVRKASGTIAFCRKGARKLTPLNK